MQVLSTYEAMLAAVNTMRKRRKELSVTAQLQEAKGVFPPAARALTGRRLSCYLLAPCAPLHRGGPLRAAAGRVGLGSHCPAVCRQPRGHALPHPRGCLCRVSHVLLSKPAPRLLPPVRAWGAQALRWWAAPPWCCGTSAHGPSMCLCSRPPPLQVRPVMPW